MKNPAVPMLAEFSSLQHCRQSRNAEADVRSDFQEKLFRNNIFTDLVFLIMRKRPQSNRLSGQEKTAEKAASFI